MGAETRAGGRAVDLAIRFSEEWLMNWYRKHALQPSELEFWRRLFGYKYSRQSRCTFYLTISAHLSSPEFSAPASWAAKASGFAGRLNIAEVRFGHEDASYECQLPGLPMALEFAAPKLSLASGSNWPRLVAAAAPKPEFTSTNMVARSSHWPSHPTAVGHGVS